MRAVAGLVSDLRVGDGISLEARLAKLERAVQAQRREGTLILLSSGDYDQVHKGLSLATGAASMGQDVHVFVTLWATAALRRPDPPSRVRGWVERVFGWLLPKGAGALSLSRMHFGGAGTAMMRRRMSDKGIPDCAELLEMAREAGVRISVCEMTMDLLGLNRADLIDYPGLELCGVATFTAAAGTSATTLVI